MIIIIGLGNPGKKFQKTRHNLGFRVVEEFQKKNNFPGFQFSKKFNAKICEGEIDSEKVILAKPQTFMNNSGKSAKTLLNQYRIRGNSAMAELPRRLIVIHDDVDLPLGKIKIVKGRGAAGHKGVESIIKELGTKNFVRFRIGIRPKDFKPKNVEKSEHISYVLDRAQNNFVRWFVLQKFNKDEEKIIKEVVEKAIEAIGVAAKEGIEKAQSTKAHKKLMCSVLWNDKI